MKRLLACILLAATAFARAPPPAPGSQVKPDFRDTIRASIYADNWFMMYVNGKLVAVDRSTLFRTTGSISTCCPSTR